MGLLFSENKSKSAPLIFPEILMSFNYNVQDFQQNAENHYKTATSILDKQYNLLFSPYYSGETRAESTIHFVFHAVKAFISATRFLLQGLLLLSASLINEPLTNTPLIVHGMFNELRTTIINVVNCAFSIIDLITRNLVTACNGYQKDILKAYHNSDGDLGPVLRLGFFGGTVSNIVPRQEQELSQETFNLFE